MGAYLSFDGGQGIDIIRLALNDTTDKIVLSKQMYYINPYEQSEVISKTQLLSDYTTMGREQDIKDLATSISANYYQPNNSFINNNELLWGIKSNERAFCLIGGKMVGTSYEISFVMTVNDNVIQKERAFWLERLRITPKGGN